MRTARRETSAWTDFSPPPTFPYNFAKSFARDDDLGIRLVAQRPCLLRRKVLYVVCLRDLDLLSGRLMVDHLEAFFVELVHERIVDDAHIASAGHGAGRCRSTTTTRTHSWPMFCSATRIMVRGLCTWPMRMPMAERLVTQLAEGNLSGDGDAQEIVFLDLPDDVVAFNVPFGLGKDTVADDLEVLDLRLRIDQDADGLLNGFLLGVGDRRIAGDVHIAALDYGNTFGR